MTVLYFRTVFMYNNGLVLGISTLSMKKCVDIHNINDIINIIENRTEVYT